MVLSSSQGYKTFILVAISKKLNIKKEGREGGNLIFQNNFLNLMFRFK